jgi:2-succinyl-5-enolpyruvyl-6-hydroxy-3-cyclohexene-1-carboxylate synthase
MNIVRDAIRLVPDGGAMVLGNGMPIRDADTVFRSTERRFGVYANRGANGIDGVLSSAAGIACERATPTILVVGDVSFYHDLPGMLALRQHDPPLTVVIINNDGGGIFQFLPQADSVPEFERLFGTPHGLSFEHAAALFDVPYAKPLDTESFRVAVRDSIATPGPSIVEAQTDRLSNRIEHDELWDRVAGAVRTALDRFT